MGHTYTKKEALRIVLAAAKEYKDKLDGRNYLFIYRERQNHKIEYFETVFLPRNFQHLTGLEYVDGEGKIRSNAVYFYRRCLNNRLTEKEIRFKEDGTTHLKLMALPYLIRFLKSSKITTMYNGSRPRLAVERLAGTTNYCIGFVRDGKYYVPASCLLEDIRSLGSGGSQILAVFTKKAVKTEPVYRELAYLAKGVPIDRLVLPRELERLISV